MTDSAPYIDIFQAIRLIVALLPDGEPLAPVLTDEWIKRGFASVEPEGSKLVAAYRHAIDLLKAAIRSLDVQITGVSAARREEGRRPIRDDERGLRLEIRAGLVATPFGRDPNSLPAFLDPLICAEDLTSWTRERLHPPKAGGNEQKRRAVDDMIKHFGLAALLKLSQAARETKIIDAVKAESGTSVSERYVRLRVAAAKERGAQFRS